VGESERGVREIFRKARAAAPSIIFFVGYSNISRIWSPIDQVIGRNRCFSHLKRFRNKNS